MADEGYSWCDRCEVLAPHYDSTPSSARMTNLSPASSTRTFDMRYDRWQACHAAGRMQDLLSAPPEPYVNLDASCVACPPQHMVDRATGSCVACPTGWVGRGDFCKECDPGTVPLGNECASCELNEISVNGVCVECPTGQAGDRITNTCVDCPADAIIDFAALPITCAGLHVDIPVDHDGAGPGDMCPSLFMAEVLNYDILESLGSTAMFATAAPNDGEFGYSSQEPDSCEASDVILGAFVPSPSGEWTPADWVDTNWVGYVRSMGKYSDCTSTDTVICGPPCAYSAKIASPVSALSTAPRVRFSAHGIVNVGHTDEPVPNLTLRISGGLPNQCPPKGQEPPGNQ